MRSETRRVFLMQRYTRAHCAQYRYYYYYYYHRRRSRRSRRRRRRHSAAGERRERGRTRGTTTGVVRYPSSPSPAARPNPESPSYAPIRINHFATF